MRIVGLDQSIIGPLAVASRGNEPGATQVCEVPGNLRLISLENFNARANAELVIAEELDEAQSGPVG
jgi:hypothetical protein